MTCLEKDGSGHLGSGTQTMSDTALMDRRRATNAPSFQRLNKAFNQVFVPGELSIGLVVPVERYNRTAEPTMDHHIERAQLAEKLGFAALWLRDVPFNVPSFGDAGQMFDPFVYLGLLSGVTDRIALGTGSIILPLRHPAHVAKAAASADVLSGGRVILGIASGDRPDEYPALNMSFPDRGERFRESVAYIDAVADSYPSFASAHGLLDGSIDMLPKPTASRVPMLVTGASQQSPDWVAQNADGWMTYPRSVPDQKHAIQAYRERIGAAGLPDKPVMQSLYIDLEADAATPPSPIHLGFRSGVDFLRSYLDEMRDVGVNHVALNLRFNQADIERTLERLAETLLPDFHIHREPRV